MKSSDLFPRKILLLFLAVSFIGLINALYLTRNHYLSLNPYCVASSDCEKVTASVYATVGDIPIALIGVFYYFFVFSLAAVYLWLSKNEKSGFLGVKAETIMDFAARFTIVGFAVSLWLVYLQLFVIQSICFYCVVSAVAATTLFILGIFMLVNAKKFKPAYSDKIIN